MRIIKTKTLKLFWEHHNLAEISLMAWVQVIENNTFLNHNQLVSQFRTASILSDKRVVFNIHGNRFRLIVDFEYRFKTCFIVWVGTHADYDKINAKNVKYKRID